ncbi:MAG: PKD domain-containing protein, partial [Bacteroidia bacterium]|nr:PKD domain-containing protein [Bacteroidia bacterium]
MKPFLHRGCSILSDTFFRVRKCLLILLSLLWFSVAWSQPLTVSVDPLCTTFCCQPAQPCSCSAGVLVSGGVPPYTYLVFGSSGLVGNSACVNGLCAGTYNFEVRDANNNMVIFPVTIGGACCKINCKDTTICYNLPDSLVKPPKPSVTSDGGTGGGTGGGAGGPGLTPCLYDSIWNNAPLVYPVGTTYVTWYVSINGLIDSCTARVIRNPLIPFTISFTTSPPMVGGVINICNGQTVTVNNNSTGITGQLWNFGNGFYSTNAVHTVPAWQYPPGTYYDTLTVYDACGNAHDTAFVVVVDSAMGPDITCISTVCPGDTVTYRTSAVCTGYTWTVSGGAFLNPPPSTSDSATVIWGPGPQGTISLSVTGCTPPLNCPNPTIKNVPIVPATLPINGDTIVCSGSENCYEVECIPGNNHIWEVLPANAGIVTGQGTCRICVKFDSTYFGPVTIQLIYQNVLTGAGCSLPSECKNDPGCGGVASITVDVRPIFGIAGPSKVCPNTVSAPFNGMNLTNNTVATGVSWKLITPVPTTLTFASTALLNAYTWNAGAGNYQLTAYAPANTYCNDSATMTVEVVNMLTPNPVTGPDTVCAGSSVIYSVAPNMSGVTYIWTVSGGTVIGPANGSSVTIQWNPGGGTVSVAQMLSAAPGCMSLFNAAKTVVTWPNFALPVVSSSSPVVCMNSTITYSIPTPLLSNATYTWSVVPATAGNILSANGTDSIVIKWISAAITPIFVKLKISRCYDDSVMVPVNLLPLPVVPNISYFPANPCVNTTVNFSTVNPGPLWNWSFGDAGTSALQNPSHVYTSAGNYNVQLYVTNASGCSDTATTAITIEDIPVVPVVNGPDSVCINALASYNFSQPLFPGANYTWSLSASPKGIISSSGNNFMNLKWTIAGIDTVKVRVQATCLDTTIKYVVVISPLPTPGISVLSPACQNTNVNFTGSGGGSYSWSFAGGAPGFSSSANPIVTYALPGTYNVSLTVLSAAGCAATTNTSMVINPEPMALINGPSTICAFPGSVTMSAVAAPGYTFLWTPTGSTAPSITTTISSLTTFSCVVTNAFGCSRLSNAITVDTLSCVQVVDSCLVNDSIDFTYTPPICLSQTYTKIYTGTLTGWSFGLGGSAGATSPVTATYPFPGIFPVTVVGVAIGTYPDGSVCTKNISRTRNVTIPFDPDFDFDYQCNGANVMQVIFTNTSQYLGLATAYNWTWYDVTYANTLSTNPFPPAMSLAPGTHVINLSVFDPATGASCTITKTINVPLPISASFTVSSPLCVGAPNTFTNTSVNLANQSSMLFNNGNGGTATSSPASIPYANSGTYTASIAVTDIYGCTSSVSQLVSVTPAGSGSITVGALACDSVSLTASGPGPFTWNIISPPPFPNNPAYVKTSGYYSVTGIGVNGCPYTAGPVLVTVNRSPAVTITGLTQYCQGEALNIKTSAAGINYAWIRLPSTPVGTNSPNLTIIANTPGTFTYQVTVTAANGCTGMATYTVNVDPVPSSASIVASGPLTFCNGDSIKLTVSPPGFTYLWSKSPAPAVPSPQNAANSLWVTQSGTYSVIVQTANGCAYPAIAPLTITVNPLPPASISGDTVLCEGETLKLTSTPDGGSTYAWTGPAASGNTNPFVKTNMLLTDAGYYKVVVTNSYGCSNTDSVLVVVNPAPLPPVIVSNPGGTLCEGQIFNLSILGPLGPPIVYNWSTGQIGTSINVVLPGSYSVTAVNQFGCAAPSNILTVHPNPDLSCAPTGCYEFCNECDSVNIPGPAGLFQYTWEMLVGNTFTYYSSNQNLLVLPPGGKFRLIGANQWGCTDSTDTLSIDFTDCCPSADTTLCADTCINFNNNTQMGWQAYPAAPNVGLLVTNFGSQGGAGDYFLQASDLSGPSILEAGFDLRGKWCCGEFCYDYKVIDDGVAAMINVNPQFRIMNGLLGFTFTSSAVVTENSGWHRICAPISDCNPPPVTQAGTWAPIAGTTLADWTTVLSNVTNILFPVDISPSIGETTGFDNACIQSGIPQIDAGNDTTVCQNTEVSLHVQGCSGNASWYKISGDSLVFVGNGPQLNFLIQQSTCFVVTCCNLSACCCDTDTVCIYVNPLPLLQWNPAFPQLCQFSDSIYLDSSLVQVFKNNSWLPLTQAGGSGFFSGPGVAGNVFTPPGIGSWTICYNYTDSLGCSATVCNTINVIFCCDSSLQISAGNDTTICAGGVAVLAANGCPGTPTWYALTPTGPIPAGQGPIFDALPQQSTCYMVICCDPLYPACCDTDTVCVFVNPHPVLQWNVTYPSLCNNGGPLTLDSSNIQVWVNNNWVPLAGQGGSGFFSGPGVAGNVFTPPGIGSWTICYNYTDSLGCSATVCNTINVIFCCDSSLQISAGNDTT